MFRLREWGQSAGRTTAAYGYLEDLIIQAMSGTTSGNFLLKILHAASVLLCLLLCSPLRIQFVRVPVLIISINHKAQLLLSGVSPEEILRRAQMQILRTSV